MTTQIEWAKLLEESVGQIYHLSTVKGGEYAGDNDRLENFKRNARALGTTPELVWAVYAGKHWDAIQQYVQDVTAGKERPRAEGISGRLDDLIVYCLLQKAMVKEREQSSESMLTPDAAYIPLEGFYHD